VHGQTRIRPRAVVWGLVVAACLFAVMPGAGLADQKPNPEPLWNAYPLDENAPSGGTSQNASTTTSTQKASATTQAPLAVTEKAGDGPPWLLMVGAGAGGALFVVVLLTLQGRRARRREEALVGVTDEWPWLASSSPDDVPEFRVQRLRDAPGMPTTNGVVPEPAAEVERAVERDGPATNGTASGWVAEPEPAREAERVAERATDEAAPERVAEPDRAGETAANGAGPEWVAEQVPTVEPEAEAGAGDEEPSFDVVEASAVPRQRFDRSSNGPAAAARKGPICQVRWSGPGTCFYAVTTDADGIEHRVAWSPPIEWGEAGPPDEESREARAALRVLSKELRDKGWRPMRAKGEDFDEPRWYARRFRLPAPEGDEVSSPRSGSARA
jgi:hypothetical protein